MAYPVIGRCPVCDEVMEVTHLHCRHCDTGVEGHFDLSHLYRLSAEQLAFVETFIRCEGKLNRVEEELKISYPTVRNRLTVVIRALGFEVQEEEPSMTGDERRDVLEKLAAGEIDSSQAVKLLRVKPS